MPTLIRQFFTPPTFEGDEEKTRRASFLNTTTILGLIYLSLIIIILLIDGKVQTSVIIIDIIIFLVTLLFRYWLRHGKIALTGKGVVILTFIWITTISVSLGTIRTPTTATYLFVVILSGFLFDWSGILVSSIASSLAVMGLILAENAGMLPQPDYTVSFIQWFTYTSLFVITGYLSFFILQTIRKALVTAEMEIAERKRVENELRKLTRAVEQSPASIVITDLAGNIEYINPRFTQITGYRLDEVIGKNPRILKTDLTPPETHRQL